MTDATGRVQPTEDEFRAGARTWLREHALRRDSREVREDTRDMYDPTRLADGYVFHRRMWEAGLAGITWPVEYGGQGLAPRYQEIFNEEVVDYEMPPHGNGAAMTIAVPMLLAHGSEILKRRHIPRILGGEECWCQFLSEPGGGSDLAGARTSAVRDGDEWVLNGSKIWTTGAHFSDYAMCLARTDPSVPKHRGLTMFVVPIPSEGLEIHPIRQVSGRSEFNQEYLTDVHVPAENVIGDVNDGWRVAQTMLGFERQMIGDGSMKGGTRVVERPDALAALARSRGQVDPGYARQLVADVWVREIVVAETASRQGAAARVGLAPPQIGSALKLLGNDVTHRRARAGMAIAGLNGIGWDADDAEMQGAAARAFLQARGAGLGGGTDEIQRNIVGERILGLAREPQVDRDIPFRDVPTSRR
jgi:alkylation response protein AidB-like acyl-CoA dehydrogenase